MPVNIIASNNPNRSHSVLGGPRGRQTSIRPVSSSISNSGSYVALYSDDWSSYSSSLHAIQVYNSSSWRTIGSHLGGYGDNGLTNEQMWERVPDATFGYVMRGCFPTDNGTYGGPETGGPWACSGYVPTGAVNGATGPHPKLALTSLPSGNMDNVWVRIYLRWSTKADNPTNGISQGFTTFGTSPNTSNSLKISYMRMAGNGTYLGTNGLRTEFSNTSEWGATNGLPGAYWDELVTTGSRNHAGTIPLLLPMPVTASSNHYDGWYELILHFKRLNVQEQIYGMWLTPRYQRETGLIISASRERWFVHHFFPAASPPTQPTSSTGISELSFGLNKNRLNTEGTMYEFYGPWEVVNGNVYSNPFGVDPVPGYIS